MIMGIEIIGGRALARRLQNIVSASNRDIKNTLRDIGEDLLSKSVNLAPIDQGDLRGSGTSILEGDAVKVSFNTVYALRQHEEMGFSHPGGGQAKYLEQPYNENESMYIEDLAETIKNNVDRG